MKNHKIKTKGTEAQANKTGIKIILLSMENCLFYDTIHEFSVWLRTDTIPSHIGKNILNIPFFRLIFWFQNENTISSYTTHGSMGAGGERES